MSRLFYHVMQDNLGNLLFDVSGTMRLAGTGTIATIYGDEAMTIPIGNPMTNHPSFGSFKCFLAPGSYDFYMAKSGYTFETLTGVQGLPGLSTTTPAIIGGVQVNDRSGNDVIALHSAVMAAGGTNRYGVFHSGDAPSYFAGPVQLTTRLMIGESVGADRCVHILYNRATQNGIVIKPSADSGNYAMLFHNAAGVPVGAISTTGAATAYNTTSDARLKHAIAPLSGALDVVRALNPITHRWRVDNSPGVGFLAHEVQTVAPEAVTGAPDAVDEAGQIVPQGMDYGKLVPYLVSAVKELTQQVEMLQAQLAAASA